MELPNSTVVKVTSEQAQILLPKTLPQDIQSALNIAIGHEYAAHYFYRNATNWCQGVAYNSAAAFFEKEAAAELEHAQKLQKYLVDWNATPVIPPIKFSGDYAGLIDVVNKAYDMEYDLGDYYNKISAAIFSTHLPTFDFLTEFRVGQVQSIAEYSDLLNAAQLVDVSNKLDLLHYEERYFG